MDPRINKYLIEMTKDITVAKLSNSNISISAEGGKNVASRIKWRFLIQTGSCGY